MEKIRGGYAYQNPGAEPRHTWGEKQTETQTCGAPGRHTIRTRNQMTYAALKSTATWLLFYLARARATNVAHKRRSQDAGDSVFGDDATQLVRGDSKQRQIEQTKFSWQTVLLNGNSG